MKQNNNDIKMGRYLSLILRHNPKVIGITLDDHGWASVDDLLTGVNRNGRSLSMKRLERIVEENNKERYIFNEDKTKIRANQGHSLTVDIQLKEKKPPNTLYHGTANHVVDSIIKDGITKQNRQHVHLCSDLKTALQVGGRHGTPVILSVDTKQMVDSGYVFYFSENKVWLCDHIPPNYITVT